MLKINDSTSIDFLVGLLDGVTINSDGDITGQGTLEVQGGEIKFWGQEKINGDGGQIWTISSPSYGNNTSTSQGRF